MTAILIMSTCTDRKFRVTNTTYFIGGFRGAQGACAILPPPCSPKKSRGEKGGNGGKKKEGLLYLVIIIHD